MENIIEELRWRGLVHDITPHLESILSKPNTVYIGFDPTSDSLHIGSLVPIMILRHFDLFGHNTLALIGGATGMIGDPSGKSQERNLIGGEELINNEIGVGKTLMKYLPNTEIVNNYEWYHDFNILDFLREVGKKFTVNYMSSKTSVKRRIEGEGISFTEFTYQLLQAHDFNHLNLNRNCTVQLGGSDQWGNITSGIDLIRKDGREAHGMTSPLITKADGSKFGKTEKGNIWLDDSKTSVYDFYQFWYNTSDTDAERYIKIFTLLPKDTIDTVIIEHRKNPNYNSLQRILAYEITMFIHGPKKALSAKIISELLFGPGEMNDKIEFGMLVQAIGDVRKIEVSEPINILTLLSSINFLSSNTERRRALTDGSIYINKKKVGIDYTVTSSDLIKGILFLQRGKRTNCIVKIKGLV